MDPSLIIPVDNAKQAYARLLESLPDRDESERLRESAILRFMLAVETAWKAARAVLILIAGTERSESPATPKGVIRESRLAGLLTDADAAMAIRMVDARNLLAHTYKEAVAASLSADLEKFAPVLGRWVKATERMAISGTAP